MGLVLGRVKLVLAVFGVGCGGFVYYWGSVQTWEVFGRPKSVRESAGKRAPNSGACQKRQVHLRLRIARPCCIAMGLFPKWGRPQNGWHPFRVPLNQHSTKRTNKGRHMHRKHSLLVVAWRLC